MTFVRGFKVECERLVARLRDEMGVHISAPLDMEATASYLEIPVHPLSKLLEVSGRERTCPRMGEIYCKVSALTVFDSCHRTIVYNDEHPLPRHRSNMAHEFAHALLGHPPLASGAGVAAEQLNEKEAAWLGGVLMLTGEQARAVVLGGQNLVSAAAHFQISPEMLRFRLNVTGAAKQVAERRRA